MISSEQPLNLLSAYPYLAKGMLDLIAANAGHVRFLLDSGAYTAWKTGKEITLDGYCKFVEELPVTPWRYFTLDVIGDPDATRRNYETMLQRGFKPVPIFTRGEAWSVLDEYYQTSDYVGLGGLLNGDESREWYVDQAIKHSGTRRVHLLGYTEMQRLKQWRPYTCDSSSWLSAERYGTAYIYQGFGRFETWKRTSASKQPPDRLLERIRQLGFKASDFSTHANWLRGNSLTQFLSAASWVAASLDVGKHLGTKLFLSCSTERSVRQLLVAHENIVSA